MKNAYDFFVNISFFHAIELSRNEERWFDSKIKDIYLIWINYWMSDSESSVEVEVKH